MGLKKWQTNIIKVSISLCIVICTWTPLTWAKPGSPLSIDRSINNSLTTSVISNQENPTEIIPACIPFQSPTGLKKIQEILDTKGFLERIVVMAMIEHRPPTPKVIIPQLEEIIANKTEPFGIRNSAIQVMAQVKTVSPKTQSVLNQIIQDSTEDPNVRMEVLKTLGKTGPQVTNSWAVLEQLMKTDDSAKIRERALMALALIEPDNQQIRTKLFQLLKKGPGKTNGKEPLWDNTTRWREAANTFVALGQENQVFGIIRSLLTHQNTEIRRRTVDSLREIILSKPRKIFLLQRALKDQAQSVQEQVLNVLRQTNISLPHSHTFLLGILKDQHRPLRMRRMIPSLLEPFKSDALSIIPSLIERANDIKENLELRISTIQTLGKIAKTNSEQPVQALLKLAQNDQEDRIRTQAWLALAGPHPTTPAVVQAIINMARAGIAVNTDRPTTSSLQRIKLAMKALPTLFQIGQHQKALALALQGLESGNILSIEILKLMGKEIAYFRSALPSLVRILRQSLSIAGTEQRQVFQYSLIARLVHMAPGSKDVKELLQEIVDKNLGNAISSQAQQGLMYMKTYTAGEHFCEVLPGKNFLFLQ